MAAPRGSGIEFSVCDGRYCVAKLSRDADLPAAPDMGAFWSLTRDDDELSIVADERFAAPGAQIERGWKAIKIKGPLDFALKGVLLSVLRPLDEVGVSVFVMSTFSTDYIFVKGDDLTASIAALEGAGHLRIHG